MRKQTDKHNHLPYQSSFKLNDDDDDDDDDDADADAAAAAADDDDDDAFSPIQDRRADDK